MWQQCYEVETLGVSPEQIWQVWSDVNHWHEWDLGIEYAKTQDPFEVGCRFVLKPKGGPKVTTEIIKCEPNRTFTDLTCFPFAKMYGLHEVTEVEPGRIRLKTTMTVTGPLSFLWRKLVAQKIANDLPQDTEKIIACARKRAGASVSMNFA